MRILLDEPKARLNLGMAVAAQQDALLGLAASMRQGAGHSAQAQSESLVGRIDVMEVQRPDTAVVAASLAPTAGLLDKQLLDAPTPAHYGLGSALQTPV